jgi:hypothetical protein
VASQKFYENEEVKNEVIVACTGGRVLWRRNTKGNTNTLRKVVIM